MRFKLILQGRTGVEIPINYQYPLSAAIYRILARGDADYASFLHERGYGKGFKLFSFSQINCSFRIIGDRLRLMDQHPSFQVAFHLPQAMESFVKGLFESEQIDIADKKSKASFSVKSVESLTNPLQQHKETELVSIQLTPSSPIVAGLQNEKGQYEFLSPEDKRFTESLVYNWRSKIEACYGSTTGSGALLLIEVIMLGNPPKSRLITVKAGTEAETKIRGWMNFGLKVTAERRFVELLMNAGMGVYNGMGCGGVDIVG